jgi:hypothetical protein
MEVFNSVRRHGTVVRRGIFAVINLFDVLYLTTLNPCKGLLRFFNYVSEVTAIC